jgi:hypothetical protein
VACARRAFRLKPNRAAAAIGAKSQPPTMRSQEDSIMWLRLRNLLMLAMFVWWTTSLIRMDPLLLEWLGAVLGS